MDDIKKKRLLPHIYPAGMTFFITFRLADSLPQSIVRKLKFEMQQDIAKIDVDDEVIKRNLVDQIVAKYFHKFEYQLEDKPYGDCVLKDDKIAKTLYGIILKNHEVMYDLKCFCIMPNHVHLVVKDNILGENRKPNIAPVDTWMKAIKGSSAYYINKQLDRKGQLWAVESFDRYIRNEIHYSNSFYYTVNNAVKAGLGDKYLREPYLWRCDESMG